MLESWLPVRAEDYRIKADDQTSQDCCRLKSGTLVGECTAQVHRFPKQASVAMGNRNALAFAAPLRTSPSRVRKGTAHIPRPTPRNGIQHKARWVMEVPHHAKSQRRQKLALLPGAFYHPSWRASLLFDEQVHYTLRPTSTQQQDLWKLVQCCQQYIWSSQLTSATWTSFRSA